MYEYTPRCHDKHRLFYYYIVECPFFCLVRSVVFAHFHFVAFEKLKRTQRRLQLTVRACKEALHILHERPAAEQCVIFYRTIVFAANTFHRHSFVAHTKNNIFFRTNKSSVSRSFVDLQKKVMCACVDELNGSSDACDLMIYFDARKYWLDEKFTPRERALDASSYSWTGEMYAREHSIFP